MADNPKDSSPDRFKPLNLKEKSKRQTAVAIKDRTKDKKVPQVVAAGRGTIAEKILQLAYDNDIKVKEDGALAEMLAAVEIDSPIPSEAFMAVAEILYYVYRANNEPNPFDAALKNDDTTPKGQS